MTPEDLASGGEIGRRLGVSRERVRQWAADPKYGFPDALGRIGASKVWRWSDVQAWSHKRQALASTKDSPQEE